MSTRAYIAGSSVRLAEGTLERRLATSNELAANEHPLISPAALRAVVDEVRAAMPWLRTAQVLVELNIRGDALQSTRLHIKTQIETVDNRRTTR